MPHDLVRSPTPKQFSDFVIYADESGDHSLTKIDPQYPIFVLTLCVFKKESYVARVVPSIQRLKFKWFGNDAIVLHEREIRKQERPFEFLADSGARQAFMNDLNTALVRASMRIVASVIEKRRLKEEYLFGNNPYNLALQFGLERAHEHIQSLAGHERLTHCIFESRGRKEDRELELEFLRIVGGQNKFGRLLNSFKMEIVDKKMEIVDKKANSSSLQIADLTARPIGIKTMRPNQPNRAYDIVARKLVRVSVGGTRGRKVRVFPQKSERPQITPRPSADQDTPIHLWNTNRCNKLSCQPRFAGIIRNFNAIRLSDSFDSGFPHASRAALIIASAAAPSSRPS